MVEKIIINPTKVRGYGNIINQHSTTDYTNYACTLTEETDTVNGAETTVHKMTDTIQFFDTCTDGTSKWSGADSHVTATSDSTGITLTWVSGIYQFWANPSGSVYDYTGDFTVEFDVVSNGQDSSIQIYDNSATIFYSKYMSVFNSNCPPCHFKIVKDGQIFRTYIDGVEKSEGYIESNITQACRVGFRSNTTSSFKFKNFKIYG